MLNRNLHLFRSFSVVSVALACAMVIGCAKDGGAATASKPKAPPTTQRIACVGDSITYGSGLKDRARDAYPAQLAGLVGPGYDVQNFGVSGATLLKNGNKPYVKESRYQAALESHPDIVVVMLGTNDSKPENWDAHKGEFVGDYKDLIASFRRVSPDAKVYVCLPVPAFPGKWGISEETITKEVIPAVRQVAKETGARVIDLHAALANQGQYFPDTVHPNERGAAEMARTVKQAVTKR